MATKNERTQGRIEYLNSYIAKQNARLATLKDGTPGHTKCVASIARNYELMLKLGGSLEARAQRNEAYEAERAPRTFEVEIGADLVGYDDEQQAA